MNLTYDLAEGHNITLKGSMNKADLNSGEAFYEDLLFLNLMQRQSDNAAGNSSYSSIAGANGNQL